MTMTNKLTWTLAASALAFLPLTAAAQGTVRIVQTNSAGDNVHLIDPVTNTVVGEIGGIERGARGRRRRPTGARSMWPTRRTTPSMSSTWRC